MVKYLSDVDAQMAVPNPQYDPNQTPIGRQRGGRNTRADAVLALIDANGDGQLSTAELSAIPGTLRGRDANQDGAVTTEEIQLGQPARNGNGN